MSVECFIAMRTDLLSTYQQAAHHLGKHDPHLAPVIARHGLCTIQPHTNYYQDLVESIIGQQLSIYAAESITTRFKNLFGGKLPTPDEILERTTDELRSVGLSGQKANYVQDLARHILDGSVRFDHLDSLTNEEIIQTLIVVKGIGEWTVHMFLMFCMGRLDVIAYSDLGIRNGVKKLYQLDHAPSPQEIKDIAARYNWQPYASIACWYIWQALDNKPTVS